MWGHQQSVTDCKNGSTIDHNAIEKSCSLGDQLAEKWSGKNFRRIGCAPSTREDIELPTRCGKNFSRQLNILIDKLDFSSRNLARGSGQVGFTYQAIRHSRRGVFVGIISYIGLWEAENFVHVRPAQVAIDQKHAITLLGQRKRVISAGKTFSFARQSTGEKRNLTFSFWPQKRKRCAQISEGFGRRTFRSFNYYAIIRTSKSFAAPSYAPNGPFVCSVRNRCENRQSQSGFRLVNSFNRAIQRIGAKNEGKAGRQPSKQTQNDRFCGTRTDR